MAIVDVVGLEGAVGGMPQHHIVGAIAVEVAESRNLPIDPYRSDVGCGGDMIIADVIDLECATGDVAQHHVVGAVAVKVP